MKEKPRKPIKFTDDEKRFMIERAMQNIRARLGLDKPQSDSSLSKLHWEK